MLENSLSTRASVKTRPGGVLTMLGTWLLVSLFALTNNGYQPALNDLWLFVSGNALRISHSTAIDFKALAYMAAMTSLALPIGVVVLLALLKICGEPKGSISNMFLGKKMPLYLIIIVTIVVEELFARLLFLGAGRLFLHGTIALYVLFFIGNGIWAWIYLYNFKDRADRNPLRVLSQFISGVLFTVVFMAHGFLAALLVHVAFDMILFSAQKLNKFNYRELFAIGLNSLLAIVGWIGLASRGHSIAQMGQWLRFDGNYAINGWSFWDYCFAVILITSVITIAADVLLFDTDLYTLETGYFKLTIIGAAILVGLNLATYWLAGLFTQDIGSRLIIVVMIISALNTNHSGSSLSRVLVWHPTKYHRALCDSGDRIDRFRSLTCGSRRGDLTTRIYRSATRFRLGIVIDGSPASKHPRCSSLGCLFYGC